MNTLFYVSGAIAIIAAMLVVTRPNAMHGLINLVLVFLALASVLYTLGAPFAAVLQIIVYAGAIMVLFVFVVMMLNLGGDAQQIERSWLKGAIWVLPAILAAVLLVAFVMALSGPSLGSAGALVGPVAVGRSLFTTYLIGVELASVLLLAALVAAFNFGAFLGRMGDGDD